MTSNSRHQVLMNLVIQSNTRKVLLAGIIFVLLAIQTWNWFYHHKEHVRTLHELDWLHHPGNHNGAGHNKSMEGCPDCVCREGHGKKRHVVIEKRSCPAMECTPCPSTVDLNQYKAPVLTVREIRAEHKVDPTWPASAKEAMIHLREKLEKEQQLRLKIHAELKDAVSQRDKFEERLRMVKRALYDTQTTQDDYFGALSTEKHRCAEKVYQLMSMSLRNRLYANALKKGNVTVSMKEWLNNLTATPSPPPPGASKVLVVSKEEAMSMINETVPDMLQRRLKETVLDLQARGWEVEDKLIQELEESPILSNATLEQDDREVEDSMVSARQEWLDTMRGSRKYIFKNLEVLIKDPIARARLVARTPDSERIFPELFQNASVQQSITQQNIPVPNKAAPKRKARPSSRTNTYTQLLTATQEGANTAPEYQRCAIVGNSQRLLLRKYGADIDEHDVVMRLNNAPTIGFEPYVGSKTTHRLVNNQWTRTYSTGTRLPLEWNVTVMASRTDFQSYVRLFTQLKTNRGDIAVVRLTMEGANRGGALLRTIGSRIERWRGLEFVGKGSPSSGFIAVYLMLQMCASLNVYGVALEGCAGDCAGSTAWHYWQEEDFRTSREFGEDPHHSFELEHDVVRLLEAENYLKLVTKSKKSALSDDKSFLSKKVPVLLKSSQDIAMKAKLDADVKCAATTGYVCGCSRTCVSPTNAFNQQMDARLKLETERVKAVESSATPLKEPRDLNPKRFKNAAAKENPEERIADVEEDPSGGEEPEDNSEDEEEEEEGASSPSKKSRPASMSSSSSTTRRLSPVPSYPPPSVLSNTEEQAKEQAARKARKAAEKAAHAAHIEMMKDQEAKEQGREAKMSEAASRAAQEHESQEKLKASRSGAATDDPVAQISTQENLLETAQDKQEKSRLIREQLMSME